MAEQRRTIGARRAAHLLGEIVGASNETVEPLPARRFGDRGKMEHRAAGFDHRPDRRMAERAAPAHQVIGIGELGDQHRHTAPDQRPAIFRPPKGVERIDPHHQFAPPETALGDRGQRLRARRVLGLGRDGIFEI